MKRALAIFAAGPHPAFGHPLPRGEGLEIGHFFTPEAWKEISRGLGERQRVQPPVGRNQQGPHPERVRGVLAPFQGAIFGRFVSGGTREERARTTG